MGLLWDLTLSSHIKTVWSCERGEEGYQASPSLIPWWGVCTPPNTAREGMGNVRPLTLLQDHSLHVYLASKYSSVIGSPPQPLFHKNQIQQVWVGGRAPNFINFQRHGDERAEALSLTNLLCNPLLLFQYMCFIFFFTSLVLWRSQQRSGIFKASEESVQWEQGQCFQ